jgi:hypothetical protein
MPTVIYISGYGHSGSTVLGILLGRLDNTLNLGEITAVAGNPAVLEEGAPAGPGFRPLSDATREALAGVDRAQLVAAEKWNATPSAAHRGFWPGLLAQYGKLTGAERFVDSSKTAMGHLCRPQRLHEAGLPVYQIHLIRDPRAVLYSMYRKRRRAGVRYLGLKTLLAWSLSNLLTWRRRHVAGPHYCLLTYEALCHDPVAAMRRLGRFTGLDPAGPLQALASEEPLDPGFQVDGNRMSRKTSIRFRADEAWKREAPWFIRLFGALGYPLYRLLRRAERRGDG